jgi:uncharacterized membrane-anchored protein YitT (DUF2179 family)
MTTAAIQRFKSFWVPTVRSGLPVIHNLFLITAGSIIFVLGMHSVLMPAGLFGGGVTGIAILANYHSPSLNIGLSYFVLNVPLFFLGWLTISRRFMLYSIFGMAFFSVAAVIFAAPPLGVDDPILAALFSGVICGLGCGLIFRSLGSAGGMDILAIFLNRRYGFRVGAVGFAINAGVILTGAYLHDLDTALYSLVYLFTCGHVTDLIISGFNARKSVLVVSDKADDIARSIMERNDRGVTFLNGQGAYSGRQKKVILTVTTLTDLPRLKDRVLTLDPEAFLVVNDTVEVLGKKRNQAPGI